jgi:hypothetical protein
MSNAITGAWCSKWKKRKKGTEKEGRKKRGKTESLHP